MGRLSPADFHTVYGFRRPNMAPGGLMPGLRSGLSLHPPPASQGLGAARLVSTPSRPMSVRAWLGIAIQGFPEFEQFCIAGFPASTQVLLKSAAYAIPPRPRAATSLMIGHLARFYTSFPDQPVRWNGRSPRYVKLAFQAFSSSLASH